MAYLKPKIFYYFFICLLSFISIFIFLINLKNNNRKFNQNLLSNTLTLYREHLEEINKGK